MRAPRFLLAMGGLGLAAGALALVFVWQPGLASLYDDSVSYLVMGQVLSPWTHASAAVADAFPLERYPPLFPLLLGLTGGAFDLRIGHALIALCFAASVFLCALHARSIVGSAAMAGATALAFALLPGAWVNLKGILSEFPYLALSLAALVQHRRLGERGDGRGWALLSLLVTAAMLTRTVGIALVAGIGAAEGLRWIRSSDTPRARRAALALAAPVAALALWYILRPAGREDTYAAIGTAMLRNLREQGAPWLAQVVLDNVRSFGYSWLRTVVIFWSGAADPKAILASAIGALALAGIAWRALRAQPDALYAIAYLGILLLFPYPAHMYRLGLPIVPVLLAAGAWALREATLRGGGGTRGERFATLASFAPAVLCLPAMAFVAQRALEPSPAGQRHPRAAIAEFYRFSVGSLATAVTDREIAILDDLDRIGETTPPGARVAWSLPDYIALLSGRIGVAMPQAADASTFAAELANRQVEYLYVNAFRVREEGPGASDPSAPARLAADYTDPVWTRKDVEGETVAALLRVDRGRLEAHLRQ
jgi:hypothetical protein